MGARFATIIAVFSLAYGFLLFHLYQVQVMKGGYYAARAASQAEAADGGSSRGAIYFTDSNGNTLPAAVNEDFPIIYAVPKDIADIQEAANILSPIVDIPAANLLKLFSKPKDQYETILRKADKTVAQQIENLKLAGIYTTIESERVYSFDSAGSQVLGYVGPNASNTGESGHYGIESFYNSKLTGTGAMLLGGDVQLTIDPNIQVEAEKVLNDMVKAQHATGGSVIVMDPRTGKILAMGGNPSFDPNNYHDAPIKNFVNTMVQGVYEPGSIFKVLTMAAGLDSGKVTPQTTYNDTGTVKINGYTLTNYDYGTHGGYGPGTTMSNIIEHSINTGAIFVENKTGNDTFLSYMKKFGLDQPTGVDLPGEATGNLRPLTPKARQVAWDTASYGQGVAVTPLALVSAVAALANGGVLMRPYINAELQPQTIRQVISTTTAAQVTKMMVSAVDHAGVATVSGYSLAGKTGSAFIPDLVHGGYTDKLIDSYVGYGPTANPRFIAFIRLDTLPSTALAAESVVPAWRTLAQYIINYYQIPPDRATR